MKKRLLATLLALMVVLTLLPTAALAKNLTSFGDVESNAWYHDAVDYVSSRGIMTGDENKSGFDNFSRSILYDNRFTDVDPSAWYYDSVVSAYELGLMVGKGDSTFEPNSNITLAEIIALACRVLSTYNADNYNFNNSTSTATSRIQYMYVNGELVGVYSEPTETWYYPYIDYALEHKLMASGQFADYTATATRADLAHIFGSMPDGVLIPVNTINDGCIPDVIPGSTYEKAAYRLYRAGVLTGSDSDGSMLPDKPITRGEVAAIAARIAVPSMRKTLTLTSTPITLYSDNGKTILVAPGKLNAYLGLGWKTEPFTISATYGAEALLNSTALLPMKTGYDKLDNLVDDILKQITANGMTTYQKIKACYDYMIQHTAYKGSDETADALWTDTFSAALMDTRTGGFASEPKWDLCDAYATLVSGTGVCDDYSAAFMVLTRRIGVESYIFSGQGPAPGGGFTGHAWNVITMGGVDYVFDSQVEDYVITHGGTYRYSFFCKTLDEIFNELRLSYKDYNAEECKTAFDNLGFIRVL